jgi:hypothetical protein
LTFRKTFSGSTFDLELCRPQRFFRLFHCCVTLLLKLHKKSFTFSVACSLHLEFLPSLFSFQGAISPVSFETRYKYSTT